MDNTKKNDSDIPELLTLKEACEVLKCHPNTLRKWDRKGILTAVRIGERKMMRYPKKEIVRFLEENNS